MSKAWDDYNADRVPADVLQAEFEAAQKLITDLCKGTRRWDMSIPAQPAYDPDLVLSGVLHHQQKEIAALRAELERVRQVATMALEDVRFSPYLLTEGSDGDLVECWAAEDTKAQNAKIDAAIKAIAEPQAQQAG